MHKAMIIIGATGSGKTSRAIEEAMKRGENPRHCSWDELSHSAFALGYVFGHGHDVVIIEGLPSDVLWGKRKRYVPRNSNARSLFMRLIKDDQVDIELRGQDPRSVSIPFLIFTILTPPDPPEWLFQLSRETPEEYRRIEYIRL